VLFTWVGMMRLSRRLGDGEGVDRFDGDLDLAFPAAPLPLRAAPARAALDVNNSSEQAPPPTASSLLSLGLAVLAAPSIVTISFAHGSTTVASSEAHGLRLRLGLGLVQTILNLHRQSFVAYLVCSNCAMA
jgi:hypothetical protein